MFSNAHLYDLEAISKTLADKEKQKSVLDTEQQHLASQVASSKNDLEKVKKELTDFKNTLTDLEIEKQNEADLIKQINSEKETLKNIQNQNESLLSEIKKNDAKLKEYNLNEEQVKQTKAELQQLKVQVIETNDEILNQSFGFYEPRYDFENSEEYQEKLKVIRQKQKDMAKSKDAVDYSENITLDGSLQKGKALTNDNIRLAIRAFNSECDSAIAKVKFNNVASCEKRINAAFKAINKANVRNAVQIKDKYRALKYDELYLAYEYEQKKEEEKQEQRELKERMREEAKVQREIEREKQKIEKEQQHFANELNRLKEEVAAADEDSKLSLLSKIEEIKNDIDALEKDKEDVFNREQNTRAGYVYIISNIGSFGDDVYKIGLTRRLDPTERVRELGDASVPFPFDIHATIFSDDAPTLETALHRTFDDRRLNKVNNRKEFFHVSLGEIKAVVEKNHNKTVEYTKLAEAQEYRQSLAIYKKESTVQNVG